MNGGSALAETANDTVPLKVGITKVFPVYCRYGWVWKVDCFKV